MDGRLKDEIAAWLEFYRDLGIDEFYRREPGTAVGTGPERPETRSRPASSPVAARWEAGPASRVTSPEPRVSTVSPPPVSLSLFEAPPPPRREGETLEQILEELGDCHRCKLAAGRKTIVFGQGNPHADLVFVGEGPGADEDEQGLPFVGRAGQLLNRMIQFIGMKREEVYICNIVKCRPPGNRTPEKDEVDICSPFLFRQLQAIQPRLVCCLGAPAMKTLLGIKEGITRVRGQFFDYSNTKAFVAYHPAYILRNPREEKILRADFETIRDFLSKPR